MSTVHEQNALELPGKAVVKLKMANLRLHSSGVFSNVYRGTLLNPEPRREIALKKTWPDRADGNQRNLELLMLLSLSREKHKNLVQVLFTFQSLGPDKRICESMIFDFLPATLSSIVKQLGPPDVNFIDIKLYTWQLFNGLFHLESKRICHRDIKPQNILVDPGCGTLKIGDFGSAKVIKPNMDSTAYQVTRFYRPPELLLGATKYTTTADVWSGGCVLGEMLKGRVLFPGRDSKHQFQLIVDTIGFPDNGDFEAMRASSKLQSAEPEPRGFQQLMPFATTECYTFLKKILVYRPNERHRGKELLLDPFFEDILTSGSKRKNGQLISSVITSEDIEHIRNPSRNLKKKTRKKSLGREKNSPGRVKLRRATEVLDRKTPRM
ncbi:hypothetical protein QR680_011968 [Steinernema hermaphroditum]|uniref:Protein kinase domain-containing protein n=1 Tax=Steinernema hermaphroditum TaxID=289476 RepID=A0AA39I1N9_9BILA|nr:hypothetical protein QR680_011968 [Steinernema hermaphroditum]